MQHASHGAHFAPQATLNSRTADTTHSRSTGHTFKYVRDTGEYVNRFHEDEADGILRIYADTSHGERTVSSMLSFFNGGVIDYDVARIKQCDSSTTGELGGLVKHIKRMQHACKARALVTIILE
ncbi:hypothetical protein PPROV_000432500 [Pycnococcus provasolii]|uniref:Uncharacterized protein n=1 Tax=Pycnococcus provasolii TaxID=41880 RepID=A0A830HF29_9CHLO|nr:hypothetical protein PPROV_000432500 [Pycnococcus provasolii]